MSDAGNEPRDQEEAPPRRERVRLYRTEAVVLRRRDLGEADRILTIFSQRHGKLRVVAKGVRRTRSKLAGHLEPCARTALLLAKGRNLDIVAQAQLVEPYRRLRASEISIAYAGYFADLLDALTVEGQPNEAAYDALVASFDLLDRGLDPFVTAHAFELRLLTVSGFRPELYRCTGCGATLEPVVNGYSAASGGVLCPACRQSQPQALPVSVNALKFLRLLDRDPVTAYRLRLSDELRRDVEEILRSHIRQVLERDLGSLAVLRMLTH
ncbi:MAG: DNA repair protein RecO [Sphaerobacter sp.]|nr:DNA repair protein RecO [Sphaerobacter sp.]